jgi:hypothetical protein
MPIEQLIRQIATSDAQVSPTIPLMHLLILDNMVQKER